MGVGLGTRPNVKSSTPQEGNILYQPNIPFIELLLKQLHRLGILAWISQMTFHGMSTLIGQPKKQTNLLVSLGGMLK